MSALTILLIRHAEKPEAGFPARGLTSQGEQDDHSLVIRGWQRAGAWAALFGSASVAGDFPRPDTVYAANPKQSPPDAADDAVSQRPYETILPLCDRLHRAPVTQFGLGDERALVEAVTKLTGVVLICWEHKRIVESILPKIAGQQTLPQLPDRWHGSRFDVVLRFDRAQSGAGWSFRQLFPRLLSGDSDVPVQTKV